MEDWRLRTEMLIGKAGVEALFKAHVAVFGLGGVGSYAAESLARSGIGTLTLIDADVIKPSNINRQLIALQANTGQKKAPVEARRVLEINPHAKTIAHEEFITPENAGSFDYTAFSYVVDAIDTVSAKIALIMCAQAANVPVISAMGCGNKLNPAMLEVADIYETSVCPLARVMRRELKKRGAKPFKVVYSKEEPIRPLFSAETEPGSKKVPPGSMAFVPGAAGLIMGAEVVKGILSL